jgi:hypothetical protein
MPRVSIVTGTLPLAALFAGSLLALSCGGGESDAAAQARATDWEAIQREHAELENLRSQLAAARERKSPFAHELGNMVGDATDRFLARLVAFINEHAGPREAGESEQPPELAEAIRTKSAEELLLAREYIERGGDYAKAIDILSSARSVDPGNQELEAAQAEAERLRYMDPERFGRIEKGMSEAEVRTQLGQVQPQNVREPAPGQVVWLYPRQDAAAAGVFFRAGADGVLQVDDTDFEAIAPAAERATEGDGKESPPR